MNQIFSKIGALSALIMMVLILNVGYSAKKAEPAVKGLTIEKGYSYLTNFFVGQIIITNTDKLTGTNYYTNATVSNEILTKYNKKSSITVTNQTYFHVDDVKMNHPNMLVLMSDTYQMQYAFGSGFDMNIDSWNQGQSPLSGDSDNPIEGPSSLKLVIGKRTWGGVGFRLLDKGDVAKTGTTNLSEYTNGHMHITVKLTEGLKFDKVKIIIGWDKKPDKMGEYAIPSQYYDGAPHELVIPFTSFSGGVRFEKIQAPFMIVGSTVAGKEETMWFDNIYWTKD